MLSHKRLDALPHVKGLTRPQVHTRKFENSPGQEGQFNNQSVSGTMTFDGVNSTRQLYQTILQQDTEPSGSFFNLIIHHIVLSAKKIGGVETLPEFLEDDSVSTLAFSQRDDI